MYKWQPAPYELYLFHEGDLTAEQQKVSEAIDVLNNDIKRPSNLLFYSVDMSVENALDAVPADVRDQYQASKKDVTSEKLASNYMLFSPQGLQVYDGDVKADEVELMSDSAGRQQIIEHLSEGDACVLVLLSGISKSGAGDDVQISVDKDATDAAAKVVLQLVNDVNAGKTELYSAPPKKLQPGQQPHTEEAAKGHTISMIQLDRTDPKEKWLVRMLMATESDLYDFDSPMVFPMYGRGRALPAFLDKGINADTITDYAVSFLTGACSCTVKEQNPGIDILMRHDWDTAAEKVAARFGAEEGNEFKFETEDFFPNLLIPTSDTEVIDKPTGDLSDNEDPPIKTNDPEVATTDPNTQIADANDPESNDTDPENPHRTGRTVADPAHNESAPGDPTDPEERVAMVESHANSTTSTSVESQGSISPVVIIGAGVGFVLLLLMGATFFMSRGSGI
jgi:hypothetical protein